jgi:LmbE family N-acetylglucosaminyl deacetylase
MTSNSGAAESSQKRPGAAARRTLSFVRAGKLPLTARRPGGRRKQKNPPRYWAQQLNLSSSADAHLEVCGAHAIKLAGVLRRLRPGIVLAPSLVENQHPDHAKLGQLVRDAARLARYGGLKELRRVRPHVIEQLFFYAVTPEAEPSGIIPVLVDVSAPEIMAVWTAAMEAHLSQTSARSYVELQLTRARLRGLRAGIGHAMALFPNDPLVFDSLAAASRGARRF